MTNPFNIFGIRKSRTVKVRSQKFIKNQDEPIDNSDYDTLNKDETVLVENSPEMRRRFRLVAQRMRIINKYGLRKKSSN